MTDTFPIRCAGCGCWRAHGSTVCCGCLYLARRALERDEGRRCRSCAAILPQDHGYSRCDGCHAQRAAEDFEYRKRMAAKRLPVVVRQMLTTRVAAGEHLPDVCRSLDITTQQAHGFKAFDDDWAEALDGALLAGRDPKLDHGSITAYRHGRCRCPECREYKLDHDSWQWRRQRRAAG
ncbi:hypothetical protein AB4Z54_00945 [Streptomyces sp. MCAF7]